MKKIKVYLQYPWKFPDSPYYKYLIQNPPEGVEYLNIKKQKGVITNKKLFGLSNLAKKIIRKTVRIIYPSMPNAHLSPNGDYDMIHCAHCLSKNSKKPWVADLEYPGQVWVMGSKEVKNKKGVKKILLRDNCKKIITWTEFMKKDLLEIFPEMKDKVEVVYPPIPVPKLKKVNHKGINLFFAARYFYLKGGLHALEVMDRITKEHSDVKGIMVSEVPEEIKKKYSKNKSLIFYPLMNQKDLFDKVYSEGDIFIYPGYSDDFGFAIPEVMSCGIPVVSVDVTTRKEIITNGKNGFVVDTSLDQGELRKISVSLSEPESQRLIKEMKNKVETLINHKKLLQRFSRTAKKEILEGKFSVKKINRQLRRIYGEALED